MKGDVLCPAWLRQRLTDAYDEESAARILSGYQARRPATLRLNPLRQPQQTTYDALIQEGISLQPVPWYSDAFVCENADEERFRRSPLYEKGAFYLQSLSSMLPPLILAPKAGESVLDMTAAPGGKTTQIAALTRDEARITACERDKFRFERLKFNVERQGVKRITLMQTDALRLDDFFRFDCILLDAPCSGSGTLSAAKEGKSSERLLEGCVALQKKLLDKAIRLLKPGGRLVYSTCSVLPEENEAQVLSCCKRNGTVIEAPKPVSGIPLLCDRQDRLLVAPDGLYEGFFVCLIRKP